MTRDYVRTHLEMLHVPSMGGDILLEFCLVNSEPRSEANFCRLPALLSKATVIGLFGLCLCESLLVVAKKVLSQTSVGTFWQPL